jgi:hypothetical protein
MTVPTADDIRVSVAIAAHPRRRQQAHALADQLDRDVSIVWDQGNDEWATHQRAWAAHDPGATHHLVLQDDAVPCADLIAGLEEALAAVPARSPHEAALSLYLGDHKAYRGPDPRHHAVAQAAALAREGRVSWVAIPGTWWGVAIVLPTKAIESMLAFCSGRREVYDLRLTRWLQHTRTWVYYPWPSLVDHADTPSLVNPLMGQGRVARQFIGQDRSALDFDPTGTTLWLYAQPGQGWPPRAWTVTFDRQDRKPFPAPPDLGGWRPGAA